MMGFHLPKLLPKSNQPVTFYQDDTLGTTESPKFDTSLRSGKMAKIDLSTSLQPTAVKLRVKWVAVPFDERVRAISAIYAASNKVYKTIPYIGPGNLGCQNIELHYEQTGEMTFADITKPLLFNGFLCQDWVINNKKSLLYIKQFAVPLEQQLKSHELGQKLNTFYYATPRYPNGVNALQPLFCYGAYCHQQSRVEDIVPYYARISTVDSSSTELLFKTQAELHADGVYETAQPPQKFYFHDQILLEQRLSLGDAITQGYCKINLNIDDSESITMKSYKFDDVSSNNHSFYIYFK